MVYLNFGQDLSHIDNSIDRALKQSSTKTNLSPLGTTNLAATERPINAGIISAEGEALQRLPQVVAIVRIAMKPS